MFNPTISGSEARAMVEQGAQLVDVRLPHEYRSRALPGSVNIPLPAIQQALKQLDKNTPVLVYCNNGQRSGAARRLLEACGFTLVHNIGSYASYNCDQPSQQQEKTGTTMEIRQLFDPRSSTYSYLVWDRKSLEAALIDPVQEQLNRDIKLVRQLGLGLKYTLETHVHTDHITGSGCLRQTFNSIVLVHENSQTKCADVLIKGGDFIPLGSNRIDVLYTPGHTSSGISYLIPGVVFTGDALLIGGCGRTDLQSGDPGTLYDSITQQLFTLPGDTVVYPGHDYQGRTSSTIAEEKASNPRLGNNKSRDEFVSIMSGHRSNPPLRMHEVFPSNLRCGTQGTETH